LKPRLTYIATCYAITFGNPVESTGVMYVTGNNVGAGGALVNHLAKVISGERQIDSNEDGHIDSLELLNSYRERPVGLSDGTETTIGASDNPSYVGPDICLLCAP